MLAKNPAQRITAAEALNHPALTVVLSQSPLHVRSVFDNKQLQNFTKITEEYDDKHINKKKTVKKSFSDVPNKIEDMSPAPTSPNKKRTPKEADAPANAHATPNAKQGPNVFGAKK